MLSSNVAELIRERTTNCQIVGNTVEIIKDRLYYTSIDGRPRTDSQVCFLNVDDDAHYESFYTDFGPLNLAVLYSFSIKLHQKLKICKRKRLIFYTGSHCYKRVNGAYLIGSYAIIYLSHTAEEIWNKLKEAQPPKFLGFRDAAMGPSTYDLYLYDVFRGVEKSVKYGWLDFTKFDAEEYEHYERVENGDFNWIIPGKILAFCGPHNKSVIENGYPYHSPETYFRYFRERNVSTIIRLNKKIYDAKRFVNAGFDHIDLFFVDGSVPSNDIVKKFIEAVDQAKGAVAVHCKAGLGRTGTLIGCWMMKELGLTAAECIAWIRICRPGCVIGPQQQFLVEKQRYCWALGGKLPPKAPPPVLNQLTSKVDHIRLGTKTSLVGIQRPTALSNRLPIDVNANLEEQTNGLGQTQGDRLLHIKATKQHNNNSSLPIGHAKYSSPTTPVKQVQRSRVLEPSALARQTGVCNNNSVSSGVGATRQLNFVCESLPTKMPRVSLNKNFVSNSGTSSATSNGPSRPKSKLTTSTSASSISDKKMALSSPKHHLRPSPYSIPNLPKALVKPTSSSPKPYYLRARLQSNHIQGPLAPVRRTKPAILQRRTSPDRRK